MIRWGERPALCFVRARASRLPGGNSETPADALERPIDVKFDAAGAMYILDFGQMQMKNGKPDVKDGTGKILRLTGIEALARWHHPRRHDIDPGRIHQRNPGGSIRDAPVDLRPYLVAVGWR